MTTFVHSAGLHLVALLARVRQLLWNLHEAFVEARQQRAILEAELFCGQCRLSSKNDDNLPIVR
jgi:hypothetical protein